MRPVCTISRLIAALCLAAALCACQKDAAESESPIPNPIPPASEFAKIQPGWTMERIHMIIGSPTATRTYTTGMASYVPFLSGESDYRAEDRYKGQGLIVYAGDSKMDVKQYVALRIIYNEEESGYADKAAYPDGPHNKPQKASTPRRRGTRRAVSPAEPSRNVSTPKAVDQPSAAPAPATPAPKSTPPASAKEDPLHGL